MIDIAFCGLIFRISIPIVFTIAESILHTRDTYICLEYFLPGTTTKLNHFHQRARTYQTIPRHARAHATT